LIVKAAKVRKYKTINIKIIIKTIRKLPMTTATVTSTDPLVSSVLKTLSIDELEVGMFVTTVILKERQNRVKNQGVVNSQRTIESLKKQGVTQVVIKCDSQEDTRLNTSQDIQEQQQKNVQSGSIENSATNDKKQSTAPLTSLNQEFNRSCEIYDNTSDNIQALFNKAKNQQDLSPQAVSLLAGEITESVIRNEYAITILTRIRHHSTYQWEHATNCAILTCGFALFLGLNKETAQTMTLGALLHDIGVAKVPKGIIEKSSSLSVNEMDVIKKHLAWGHQLCKRDGFTDPIIMDMLINHHERLDGSGYPRGLKKEKLSKLARITAIIDVYDAMTGSKNYKAGQQPINAFRYLLAQKEQFDQELVQQFIKFLGVHPVGSLVQLSNEKIAVVTEGNRADPLRPRVKVFYSIKLQHLVKPKDCDLAIDSVSIITSVRAEDHNINSSRVIRDVIS
jgi:HD-GYP domain-containing protein (c-di-GMP phosphodiesterase class II)